ncbi:hypothetical protein BKA61DRAFT_652342 [Leptodontidium sp. MPI-SDFR-AT-0119]|nr:hypothetical protein BKA61DRAFT_652342 [Leptodontidium sp. MPI-SDFR-AT-0119]
MGAFQFFVSLLVAQVVNAAVTPFVVSGFLDGVSVNNASQFNSGGFVQVNGFNILIPDNMLVEFPAAQVPFKDFVAGNRAGTPANEVLINGNDVNGIIVAGQMQIAQALGQVSQGTVESVAFDGSIKIVNGPTIRINDPNAVFSAGYTAIPLFTADDQNPSVTSFGGFPMCVPRSVVDPQCPQSNRPTNVANPNNYFVPDPFHMAPIKPGDFLVYSGIKVGTEIICYSIVVNIGIFTQPGAVPAFIRVEEALIGILDPTNIGTEDARSRFIGYTTDPSQTIQVWAIDVDPCTGATSDRLIGFAFTEPAVGLRARWKFESSGQSLGEWTRNYRLKVSSGQANTTDGILAGQFVQPVLTWVFPEVTTPGLVSPPLEFSNIQPLANGFGPDPNGFVFHQLNPWPGATTPLPKSSCPDFIPPPTRTPTPSSSSSTLVTVTSSSTASATNPPPGPIAVSAGSPVLVRAGSLVTLTAIQTTPGYQAADFTYIWTQIAGKTVTAANAVGQTTSQLKVTLPTLGTTDPATVSRTFQVVVKHTPTGQTATSSVVVTEDKVSSDHPVIDVFTWVSTPAGSLGGVLQLNAHTDLVLPTGAALTMLAIIDGAAPVKMSKLNPGVWQLTQQKVFKPASVTVVSQLDGVQLLPGVTRSLGA